MGNFGDVRNRRGEGPVRISRINTGKIAAQSDLKCWCAVSRRVDAHVEHWTEDGIDYWKTFLDIQITTACKAAADQKPFELPPFLAQEGGFTAYTSYKETYCNKKCKCDLNLGDGISMTRMPACIGSMTIINTNLTINESSDPSTSTISKSPAQIPKWASVLTQAGEWHEMTVRDRAGPQRPRPAWATPKPPPPPNPYMKKLVEEIAKEQGGQMKFPPQPKKTEDKLEMGPYDKSGHPYCIPGAIEGKECCGGWPASQLGKETSLD
jgi:hypothetical protein